MPALETGTDLVCGSTLNSDAMEARKLNAEL